MQLTANQLSQSIGQIVSYPMNGLVIQVEIQDAKIAYGVPRVLIKPVAGSGSAWVNAASLQRAIETSLID